MFLTNPCYGVPLSQHFSLLKEGVYCRPEIQDPPLAEGESQTPFVCIQSYAKLGLQVMWHVRCRCQFLSVYQERV